jgi:hypothetical protein
MSNDDVKVTATTMAWLPTEFVGVVSKSRKEKTGKPEQERGTKKKKKKLRPGNAIGMEYMNVASV